tara:strand:- start:9188 stop:10423 length:1236 start_codon:yes stop_codon:yes gene_type:complete
MAYSDIINALSPSVRYILDGDANDAVGVLNGTNSGGLFSGVALCEGVTNSYLTDGITDRITLPTSSLINNAAQSRKMVCGWFSVTGIQNPPKSIYGEGDTTQSLRLILGWGNNVVFEVDSSAFTLQVFGNTPLEVNRAYHLTAVFEGNGFGNEFRAYIDGVRLLGAEPTNSVPNSATLPARTVGEFGDPAGNVSVGGTQVTLLAPINGQYNEWVMFDGAPSLLTDTQIRQELFEKGALPDVVITNQAGLDVLANTMRPDVPCCIRITGDGVINLSADNVTFNPLASIQVQYTGTGTVNWTNINGSSASIGSTTNGGVLNFINPATLTLNGLIAGSEIRIYDNEIVDGGNMNTELGGVESLAGTSFTFSHSGTSNDIIIQAIVDGYVEISRKFTLSSDDQILTLFPSIDGNA